MILILMLAACLGISACGKKASDVEPGEGMRSDGYPLNYPDLAADPPGTYVPQH